MQYLIMKRGFAVHTFGLDQAKLNVMKGKKVRFDLSDGYGEMELKFGKVVLKIVTDGGSSIFRGDFTKIQKTFSKLGDNLEFYLIQ